MTNHHVVNGVSKILIVTNDKSSFEAKLIGSDKRSDLALLKIDAENLPTVKIASDDKTREWVLIGSPFGFNQTVTAGIVSGKQRKLAGDNYVPYIQTDVAINPGNFGGPLFNFWRGNRRECKSIAEQVDLWECFRNPFRYCE